MTPLMASDDLRPFEPYNAIKAAVAEMTWQQRSLLGLRELLAFGTVGLRELSLRAQAYRRGLDLNSDEMLRQRRRAESAPLATDPEFKDWKHSTWWVPCGDTPPEYRGLFRVDPEKGPQTSYMVLLLERHRRCGGTKRWIGPSHVGCTGCAVEVRLWEHGIGIDDPTAAGLRMA